MKKENKIILIIVCILIVIFSILLFLLFKQNKVARNINNEDVILGDTSCTDWSTVGIAYVTSDLGNCTSSAPSSGTSWCKLIRTITGSEASAECLNGYRCYLVQRYSRSCKKDCPAGYGDDPSATTGCSMCAAGYYSPDNDGTCTKCEAGYTSTAGSSKCTEKCAGAETYNVNTDKCEECKIVVETSKKKVSESGNYAVRIYYSGCYQRRDITITTNGSFIGDVPTEIFNKENGAGSKKVTIQPAALKQGQCSGISKTSVSYNGTTYDVSVTVKPDWAPVEGEITSDKYIYGTDDNADIAGDDIHASCTRNGDGKYTCKDIFVRGKGCVSITQSKCYTYNKDSIVKFEFGSTSPGNDWEVYKVNGKEVTTSSTCGACFGNTPNFKDATKVKWSNTGNTSVYQYIYKNVSKDQCNLPPKIPDICENSYIKPSGKKANATTCGGVTSLENTVTICDNPNSANAYYQVKVTKTYSSQVDYQEYSTKPGVGFKYDIIIDESDKVVATFDKDKWIKHYNDYYNEMKKYKNDNPWYWYYKRNIDNLVSNLEYYNNNYINWNIKEKDIKIGFNISYKENGKTHTMEYNNFIKDTNASKQTKNVISKTPITINVNGEKYTTYNIEQTIKSTTKMIPNNVTLTRQSRYLTIGTSVNSSNQASGGNKIYITINEDNKKKIVYLDDGTYNINLTVNIDGNVITNNKCPLVIKSTNLIYRIINVTNPFINKNYPRGVNWLNSTYDYTKVIRSDTWTRNPQLVINLSPNDIKKIQKDNDDNWNKGKSTYLGKCYTPQNLWSEADKIVCSKIKMKQ